MPTVNPLAEWRLLIKGMGGGSGIPGKHYLTFNTTTKIWSRTTAGIINYTYDLGLPANASAGGPYWVNPIIVPFDPIHQTGGSFWELKEGPNVGWLVSDWTNSLGYGSITVGSHSDFNRGPGATLATIYRPAPHLAGASMHYNAAGEMHFTLLVDDPNINVPIPKQTHYAIEFKDADSGAWVECFAGWIWDFDATDTEVVFYGIDYLATYQYVFDERFNPRNPDAATPTGSKYVKQSIHDVVSAQLTYSQQIADSPVGFIAVGSIAAMPEVVSIYSTFMDTLTFVVGLINSHKAGSGKQTRLSVKKIAGVYTVIVEDDPGTYLDALPLIYAAGEKVNGYHVIPFGTTWASRVNLIGRTKDGLKVFYQSNSSAVDQGIYGRIGQPVIMVDNLDSKDAVSSQEDLNRRTAQAAADAAKIGRQISVGAKLGSLRPWEGYDICDSLPIQINHGAVHTANWGSDTFGLDPSGDPSGSQAAYWAIIGLTWESYDDGHWMSAPILWPRGGGKPYVPAQSMRFVGSCNGGWPGNISVWASDVGGAWGDGSAWHEALSVAQVNAGASGDNTSVNIPPTEVGHLYWAMRHSVYDSNNGLHYVGGIDVNYCHLYDQLNNDLFDSLTWITGAAQHISGHGDAYNNDANAFFSPRSAQFGIGAFVEWAAGTRTFIWAVKLRETSFVRTEHGAGYGPPSSTNDSNVATWTNLATGQDYTWSDDTATWTLVTGSGTAASGLYDFDFTSSTSWVVVHTLGGYPRVTLTNSSGEVIEANIVYTSTAVITVTFSSAIAGHVHLG